MAKFTKDGSTATSAAIRLARAHTGRDLVGLCIDHPFFSYDDWAIAVTPMSSGIPKAVSDLTLTFHYNDIASVQDLFDRHPGQIAGLIMEPAKDKDPENRFLHQVRDLCHRNGAVFILDEMITGFRWPDITAQRHYEIEPDLSTCKRHLQFPFRFWLSASNLCNTFGCKGSDAMETCVAS